MSEVRVRIPTPLRGYTSGADEVQIAGSTVGEVLHHLSERYPGLHERMLNEQGELRGFVNVFLDERSIRDLDGLATPVRNGAVVAILPAVAGGGI